LINLLFAAMIASSFSAFATAVTQLSVHLIRANAPERRSFQITGQMHGCADRFVDPSEGEIDVSGLKEQAVDH
jgi:hypothetical protein